jgi:Lrp/AsnC family transcriptional regulator
MAARFLKRTNAILGILSVYRMTGDLDYLISARVSDMADYDRLYQQLITHPPLRTLPAVL